MKPEPPRFEQIAERLIAALLAHAAEDLVRPDAARTALAHAEVVEQLRLVWNSRGAADNHAVTIRSMELLGTSSGGIYAGHFSRVILALDRA